LATADWAPPPITATGSPVTTNCPSQRISVPSQRARQDIRRPGQEGEFKGAEYSEFRNPSVSGSQDAEKAGPGIEHPILHVAVYDGVESVNEIIES